MEPVAQCRDQQNKNDPERQGVFVMVLHSFRVMCSRSWQCVTEFWQLSRARRIGFSFRRINARETYHWAPKLMLMTIVGPYLRGNREKVRFSKNLRFPSCVRVPFIINIYIN